VKAAADYGQLMRISPDYAADWFFGRANAWEKSGDASKALADWREYKKLRPDDTTADQAIARLSGMTK
jgi:predicted TPR repeat methyltransferase